MYYNTSADCHVSWLTVTTGLLTPRVPEVFLPLKQCIEILGAGLQPKNAQAILERCLQGIAQKVICFPISAQPLQQSVCLTRCMIYLEFAGFVSRP